ncbi:formate dehydrogenase accessory sulfurtransferase FdhD [[Pseudomonas] boreopolis]|uniref:Sulfur carrier protein FdhD n=1 Tax=Xanthomonas boreopolis TaxID=86183 RepID=A0A919KG69_9XANT|nr:sulfurtransferase FdhD [[Pseudomonas] boreopolis]
MPEPSKSAQSQVPGCVPRSVLRRRGDQEQQFVDAVAEEVPVAMVYNGHPFAVMMATPCDLDDFALGFSLSEGLIRHPSQLLQVETRQQLEGIELAMTVAVDAPAAALDDATSRLLPGRGGCGVCGTRLLEDVLRPPPPVQDRPGVGVGALRRALATLGAHQPMNAVSGATHAAAWADREGHIVLVREDVGRHNALDKLVGAMHRAGIAPAAGMLVISSRASYEMVTKAARAGIGFMVAVSAPTALAVDLARGAGVCLVGFARQDGYNVYTFPERLLAE